jgi:hypothetical protein
VQFVLGRRIRVLHGHLRTELEMGSDGISKWLVAGHCGPIERGEVEVDESSALLFCDRQSTVDCNEVRKSKFSGEPSGNTK